nr:MAG TPA: hypothetical protein [Caudoviricetes sp.]
MIYIIIYIYRSKMFYSSVGFSVQCYLSNRIGSLLCLGTCSNITDS